MLNPKGAKVNKEKDWLKVKNEYINSNISQRKLAEKHKISFNTLKTRANKENWAKLRTEAHNKKATKTQQKTIEKVSDKLSDRNAKFLEVSDLALEAIAEYLSKKLYNKHVIKTKYIDIDTGKITSEITETKELDAPDTRAFSNMINSLEKVQKGHRLAEGLDNPEDKNVNVSLDLKTLKELFENDNS